MVNTLLKKGQKYKSAFANILVFLLIYVSMETLLFGTSDVSLLVTIGKFFEIILIIPLFLIFLCSGKRVNPSHAILLFILLCCIFLTIIFNNEEISLYLMMISIIIVCFFVSSIISFSSFRSAYSNVLLFLSIISLFVFAVRLIYPNFFSFLPTVRNFLGYEYKTYFLGVFTCSEYSTPRNSSIFRESGVFAIYLSLALVFELFHRKKPNVLRIIIFTITSITTFSSTVFIIVPSIFLVFVLFNKKQSAKTKMIIITSLIVLAAILIAFGKDLIESTNVLGKFKQGLTNDSFVSRFGSVVVNAFLFIKKPIFGNGEYAISNIFEKTTKELVGIANPDNTNSFLFCFSAYGFLFGLAVITGWYNSLKTKRILVSTILFALIVVLFSGENLIHSTLFFLMVFYGFSKEKKNPIYQ